MNSEWTAGTPIPDRDIWRAAELLVHEYEGEAELLAAHVADGMREQAEYNGAVVWLRIKRAIAEIQALPTGRPN